MIIDKGFSVENYVGKYEMKFNQELNATFIVSREVNHAEGAEQPLVKKRIFEFDRRDDEYISLQLANVDISSDSSILEYCNKYGLPFSSQTCFDDESGLDDGVGDNAAQRIIKKISAVYSREDTMTRLEFYRLAVQVRSIMELKEILDRPDVDQATCSKLISLLTYLTFYSREFIYDYDATDPIPYTRIMNLQYAFHLFCKSNWDSLQLATSADRISTFLNMCGILKNDDDVAKTPMVLADLMSEENLKVLHVFENIFIGSQCSGPTGVISGKAPVLGKIDILVLHTKNQFVVDKYRRVTFVNKLKYDGDVEELKQVAIIVLRDVVNEGLMQINPRLVFENGAFSGEWQLRHQMEGIYMELFTEIAMNSQYRICANPTCGKFFSVSRSRPNKRFCCHECAALQMKRNQRAREKSNSGKGK